VQKSSLEGFPPSHAPPNQRTPYSTFKTLETRVFFFNKKKSDFFWIKWVFLVYIPLIFLFFKGKLHQFFNTIVPYQLQYISIEWLISFGIFISTNKIFLMVQSFPSHNFSFLWLLFS
jgi:hypothetical protein